MAEKKNWKFKIVLNKIISDLKQMNDENVRVREYKQKIIFANFMK